MRIHAHHLHRRTIQQDLMSTVMSALTRVTRTMGWGHNYTGLPNAANHRRRAEPKGAEGESNRPSEIEKTPFLCIYFSNLVNMPSPEADRVGPNPTWPPPIPVLDLPSCLDFLKLKQFPLKIYPAVYDAPKLNNDTLYIYGPGFRNTWASFDVDCLQYQARRKHTQLGCSWDLYAVFLNV